MYVTMYLTIHTHYTWKIQFSYFSYLLQILKNQFQEFEKKWMASKFVCLPTQANLGQMNNICTFPKYNLHFFKIQHYRSCKAIVLFVISLVLTWTFKLLHLRGKDMNGQMQCVPENKMWLQYNYTENQWKQNYCGPLFIQARWYFDTE